MDMKVKLLTFIMAILCVSPRLIAGEPTDSAYESNPYFILMGEADRAIADRDWNEAAARLIDVLTVDPHNPSNALVYYDLGMCYSYMDSDSLALDNYDRSLAIAPNMVMSLLGKGQALLRMKRDYEAYDVFSRAIEVDSVSTEARYYHGMMALYGGSREIAERDFAVLERMAPHSTDTAIALSTLYSLTGRDREAIPYLKRLVADEPSPEYYSALAGCYLEIGDLTEASAIIAEGLHRYPSDPELYYYRARLNRDRYRHDDARADAARAIELGASPARVNDLFSK